MTTGRTGSPQIPGHKPHPRFERNPGLCSTFSIVAVDRASGSLGVAVASKFLAVGSVVPWARAGVGAVATQAWVNTSYGPKGLALLEQGLSVEEVVRRLVVDDEDREFRQFGIVDAGGRAAAYTGSHCPPWAGHVVGPNFACQGNILAGPRVIEAMAEGFEAAGGDLAARLLTALRAGEQAGGDRRGRQSAAILVVKERGGYGGFNDRYMDLRVDDHPDPIAELERLVRLFRLCFETPASPTWVRLEGTVLHEVQQALVKLGYLAWPTGRMDEASRQALQRFHAAENLERREHPSGEFIDRAVLEFLQERAGRSPGGRKFAATPLAPTTGALQS